MISLHIAKWLDDEGFGTLENNIFWETMPVTSAGDDAAGLWVVTRGSAIDKRNFQRQSVDIYHRSSNKLAGQVLEDILEKLWETIGEVCTLPAVPPYSDTIYTNVRFNPTSSVENAGVDSQGWVVRVISVDVAFNK